ncbi:hypothetical protein BJX99DRAFT_259389 [Aspergillus californicus]
MTPRSVIFPLLCLSTFFSLSTAQYGFTVPIPGVADFDSVNDETQGTVFDFHWLVNSTWQPTITGEILLDSNDHVSLWITSFNGPGYTKCLAASVYSGSGGSWAWTIDLTDNDIDDHDGKFVYRLKPTVDSVDSPYDETENEVPSRGFRIIKASDAESSSSSSSTSTSTRDSDSTLTTTVFVTTSSSSATESESSDSSTTSTTADSSDTTSTSTSDSSPSTSSPETPNTSDGLSADAKAGIGAGAAVGGLIIIAGAVFLWWRHRARARAAAAAAGVGAGAGAGAFYPPPPGMDMHSTSPAGYTSIHQSGAVKPYGSPMSELSGHSRTELDGRGYDGRGVYELGSGGNRNRM